MPPYLKAVCTNKDCGHANVFDLADIQGNLVDVYKGAPPPFLPAPRRREYRVVCKVCHTPFIIQVSEASHGQST